MHGTTLYTKQTRPSRAFTGSGCGLLRAASLAYAHPPNNNECVAACMRK